MRQLIETALRAAELAKLEANKIKDRMHDNREHLDMADDAVLGIGWAIKRLKDLDSSLAPGDKRP